MSPWKPLPTGDGGRSREPRPLAESLDRLTSSLGVPSAASLGAVFERWADIVGEGVAAHVQPRSLRDGTLVVVADQPVWVTQLRFLEADVLRRLTEVAGFTATHLEVRLQRS